MIRRTAHDRSLLRADHRVLANQRVLASLRAQETQLEHQLLDLKSRHHFAKLLQPECWEKQVSGLASEIQHLKYRNKKIVPATRGLVVSDDPEKYSQQLQQALDE
jgi:hypothetical protein